jgi:hypothetical protein
VTLNLALALQIAAFACFIWATFGPFPEPERNHKRAQFVGAGLSCLTAALLLGAGLFH